MSGRGRSLALLAAVASLLALLALLWLGAQSTEVEVAATPRAELGDADALEPSSEAFERVPLPEKGEDTREQVVERAFAAGMAVLRCATPIREAAGVELEWPRLDRSGRPLPTGVIFDSELVLPILRGAMSTGPAWIPGEGTVRVKWDATSLPVVGSCDSDVRPTALVEGVVAEFDDDTRVIGCGVIKAVGEDGRFLAFVEAPVRCALSVEGVRDGLMFESEAVEVDVRPGERIEVVLAVGEPEVDGERHDQGEP
ncbi:MAG: hypothetical protein KC912_07835 [Proteobacteria bacterium]|nr:hypothetical protein [Pseudomonadota bacterium]